MKLFKSKNNIIGISKKEYAVFSTLFNSVRNKEEKEAVDMCIELLSRSKIKDCLDQIEK